MAATPGTPRPINPARQAPGSKSSDILGWMKGIERGALGDSTAVQDSALWIYIGIKKANRAQWRADRMLSARRMRRQALKIAACYEAAGKQARAFQVMWKAEFEVPGSKQPRGGIELDK